MNTLFLVLIVSLCGLSRALALPVARDSRLARQAEPGVRSHAMKLVGMYDPANQNVANFQDTVYATNLTIGGQEILIQLDTGSSDLWVQVPSGSIKFNNVTNITGTQTYGLGAVTGPIALADVSMGPHDVSNQAFINATNATDFGTIFGDNVRGILGLAFDAGSAIDIDVLEGAGVNATFGRTFITNLFLQSGDDDHFFTVQLGRESDPEYTTMGVFTIGEYIPEFSAVANQPQLARFPNDLTDTNQPRWSTIVNGMTVNGQSFTFNTSGVPGTPEGSVVAVLDTGFTFPPLPEPAVNFIYGSIPGASYDNSSSLWIVPCENTTTLEFQFDNFSVPIHPLDITTVTQLNNETVCVNTFRPSTFPVNTQFDIILGDAFLKNVYASFNYGNFSLEDPQAIPFIQLLPTTDLTTAMAEFAQVRQGQVAAAVATSSVPVSSALPTATAAPATDCGGDDAGDSAPAVPTSTPLFASAWSSYPASAWSSYPASAWSSYPASAWSSYPASAWSSYPASAWSSYAPAASASPVPGSAPSTVNDTSATPADGSSVPLSADAPCDDTVPSSNAGPVSPSYTPASPSSTSAPASLPVPSAPTSDIVTGQAAPTTMRRRSILLEPSRTVSDCLGPLLEQYGAVIFTLLAGTLVVSLALCVVSVVITIRNHARSQTRRQAAYSVLAAKAEAEADPEADVLSARCYYRDD